MSIVMSTVIIILINNKGSIMSFLHHGEYYTLESLIEHLEEQEEA